MPRVRLLAAAYVERGGGAGRVQPGAESLVQDLPRRASADATAPFLPYRRDERLARPWAVPGTPGLEHRTGGLEKEDASGNVSYEPLNHEWMVRTRERKIANIAADVAPLAVDGPERGDLLVLGWGSTFGTPQ